MTNGESRRRAAPRKVTLRRYSSPACYAHEVDPAYAGYYGQAELLAFLNRLLEDERAGARLARTLRDAGLAEAAQPVLGAVRDDAARFGRTLARIIRGLGGTPSKSVRAFHRGGLAVEGFAERLAVLNRGQDLVARRLEEALPRVRDDTIHRRLKDMLDTHRANIVRCAALLDVEARRG
jgi:Domain of unknown function (DUF6306)